jgi:hypothetical protein
MARLCTTTTMQVLWMVPIVILENVTQVLLINRTGLPEEGMCGMCILSSFLQVREAWLCIQGLWNKEAHCRHP